MVGKSVTSLDVAKLAGVARSTVSHVLNGSNAVSLSDETRRKVQQAALTLGYRPNSAALMLRQGTTKTVGLLVTEAKSLHVDAYIPLLFTGVGEILRRRGYHLLLETFESVGKGNPYADLVVSRRIDGLLVLSPNAADSELCDLVRSDFPVVLFGSVGLPEEISVSSRLRTSIEEAADHLAGLGHRRIGCVPFSPPGFSATDSRTQDFAQALERHGLTLEPGAIEHADFSAESGNAAARRLLSRRPDLTAILAGNDTIALGVIGGAVAEGFSVPGDLSIVGFDDLPFAGHIHPALTTIRQDAIEQGRSAAELLVRRLSGEPLAERQVKLDSRFIPRASTGLARG